MAPVLDRSVSRSNRDETVQKSALLRRSTGDG